MLCYACMLPHEHRAQSACLLLICWLAVLQMADCVCLLLFAVLVSAQCARGADMNKQTRPRKLLGKAVGGLVAAALAAAMPANMPIDPTELSARARLSQCGDDTRLVSHALLCCGALLQVLRQASCQSTCLACLSRSESSSPVPMCWQGAATAALTAGEWKGSSCRQPPVPHAAPPTNHTWLMLLLLLYCFDMLSSHRQWGGGGGGGCTRIW